MRRTALALTFVLAASTAAIAACPFENKVPIRSLTAGFEAWKAVTGAMAECGNFRAELDQEFRTKQPAAFAAKPSLYHLGGVANETMVPLVDQQTIRPLDDLVAKHGKHLSPNQLIKVDGKIMAIAMMVNTQHLMYRKDILAELNIAPPTSYDEMLAAAEKIKQSGKVRYPIGATMRTGWNLAQDFVNMHLGFGGTFFAADNKPTVNSDAGVKTLEMMKKLSAYMDPEFLTGDSTYVQQQFQKSRVAMANFWASRAGAMDNAAESEVVGKVAMASAPRAMANGKAATTLWWDGIVIAKNITDEEAEAAFKLAMHGLGKGMVQKNNAAAVWLVDGYQPGAHAQGVIQSLQNGAPAFPASPQMGLMHAAIGNNIADFFTGKATAPEALTKVEAAYLASARERGLVK
ncbi:MAG: extracellular solute-binding protein [Alphaproteobacteria bacterium]|nr:extracellular solute-binding protein [Alphaproteobacteria bacterium]